MYIGIVGSRSPTNSKEFYWVKAWDHCSTFDTNIDCKAVIETIGELIKEDDDYLFIRSLIIYDLHQDNCSCSSDKENDAEIHKIVKGAIIEKQKIMLKD